jgi:hypothetical protein
MMSYSESHFTERSNWKVLSNHSKKLFLISENPKSLNIDELMEYLSINQPNLWIESYYH